MLKELTRKSTAAPPQHPVRILQFGEGNFLRAFADWMIDLLNEKANFQAAVQLVQPINSGLAKVINTQDGLYHVILEGLKEGKTFQETRLITCVAGCLNPYDDYAKFLALSENADLKFIISNTTEAGIAFDERDVNPKILPNSFPGKITALLFHRFNYFHGSPDKSLVIIPCELIDQNGTKLREIILKYCDHWELDQAFKSWINDFIFCNTLVDRIVPGFPKETINEKQVAVGYADNLMVTAEPFHLWVIESEKQHLEILKKIFPLHQAGLDVKWVEKQAPYRTRKVRILNGAHTAMVPVAYLHGLRTVKESMDDNFISQFIRDAIFNEIIPTLDLDKNELTQFANDVLERFQNPFIRHELISISLNSISKYKVRVLPSVLEFIKRKKSLPEKLIFSLAALIRFYKGEWQGQTIPVSDTADVMKFMKDAWSSPDINSVTRKVLSNVSFWDQDLTLTAGLLEKVTTMLTEIDNAKSVSTNQRIKTKI